MKACIALLYPPKEFCVLDDDLFVIDSVADALEHFRHAMPTGTFNAGLYWCRQVHDSRRIAGDMLRSRPAAWMPFLWEQGFIASTYARSSVVSLPSQRYLFPVFDGLPGGMLGYDYANNPCGLASVHFGGLGDKPSDAIMAYLAPEILGRNSPPWTASAVDVALGSEAEAVLSGTEQHAEPAAL
jgi:hypothetical protein